ncbi:MAG: molecular chaperone HtpG [Pseudomonadota bacterium]
MAEFETRRFEADEAQVLKLMIHSLYSNKEIFLRELISNASDALDKLRTLAIQNPDLYEGDTDLKISISFDKEAGTLTVTDNGIGMSQKEVIENLGTIARSGTKRFLDEMGKENVSDAQLIGQFGVGFYSTFIVADKVTVETRRASAPASEGVRWSSEGSQDYHIGAVEKADHGTSITLHLKEDEKEFLEVARLRHIITKYSDHIRWKVSLKWATTELPEVETSAEAQPEEKEILNEEVVNEAQALWTLTKSEIKDEQYCEFYKRIALDYDDPIIWSHNKVEGRLEYTSLLFVPKRAPFDIWNPKRARGLKLYVNRVFILDDAEQFLPNYLRFVKGVIDCKDLPLNVSRELLQQNRQVENIRSAITKRVLQMLADAAKNDAEKYVTIWKEFGHVLKEGIMEDFANRDVLADLMRFSSTHDDTGAQTVALADYLSRMKPEQDKVYYIAADSYAAAKNSPHLEAFRRSGTEVLLMTDRIDEWMVSHFGEYEGKKFQSITKGDVSGAEQTVDESVSEEFKPIASRMEPLLDGKVKSVRLSTRLVESPSCIVVDEHDITRQMAKILNASGHEMTSQPILELNPEHWLVKRLQKESNEQRFSDLTQVLYGQAILAEGGQLENPADFVKTINQLLSTVAQ